MKRVLFVCLGNICRSPAAEVIMKKRLSEVSLGEQVFCDSCGTSDYHQGELADARMRKHATARGYELTSRSRPFVNPEDFENFDFIISMDHSNHSDLVALVSGTEDKARLYLMTSFCRHHHHKDVPDPYYGGDAGFELVLDILEDGVEGLIYFLKTGEYPQ